MARRDLESELVPMLVNQSVGPTIWNPEAGRWLGGKCDADQKTSEASRHITFEVLIFNVERACARSKPVRPMIATRCAYVS